MDRIQVVQGCLELFSNPSYLEIGVNAGLTFHNVNAARKVAVDPAFTFSPTSTKTVEYFQLTSDDYFSSRPQEHSLFDVVFIDGLHTFEQTLRDLMNTLSVVNEKSVIIIDDVLPLDYASSLSKIDDLHRFRSLTQDPGVAWMGDVYKLVFFIAAYLPQYSYATVKENHGQTIMWREARKPDERFEMPKIVNTSFADTVINRDAFHVRPYAEIHADLMRVSQPKVSAVTQRD